MLTVVLNLLMKGNKIYESKKDISVRVGLHFAKLYNLWTVALKFLINYNALFNDIGMKIII